MAQPLSYIPAPARDDSPEDRLRKGAAKHADAILNGFELLQLLHDRGVLDLMRGVLASSDEIVETLTSAVNTPQGTRAIRNFVLLTKFFGSLPPEVLDGLSQKKKTQKAPSLQRLFRRLGQENVRYALSAILDLAESAGKGL